MSRRPGYSWLRGLIVIVVLALPAQAASQPPVLAIADPTQRALFDQLFLEAQGPHPSFARDLPPGRADEHLAWFPLQYLVPLAYSGSASGAYWVFADGLTNVKVTITVTDTQTGQSHQYNNAAQTTFQPVQDTGTFKTCP